MGFIFYTKQLRTQCPILLFPNKSNFYLIGRGVNKLINLLKSHRTVRKYKNEKISDEVLYELINAAQYASSSSFLQSYSVIHIKDRNKIKKIGTLSNNELQFNTAALSLVFCADYNKVKQAMQIHETNYTFDSIENFLVATIDTSIFAQNFAIAAESKGYGVCYIGGIRNNPKQINDILSIPDYVLPLFGMTVGVPDENNEIKPRLPISSVIHTDKYRKDKILENIEAYDKIMMDYYTNRGKNNRNDTWSSSIINLMSKKERLHLKEFIMSKGFLT